MTSTPELTLLETVAHLAAEAATAALLPRLDALENPEPAPTPAPDPRVLAKVAETDAAVEELRAAAGRRAGIEGRLSRVESALADLVAAAAVPCPCTAALAEHAATVGRALADLKMAALEMAKRVGPLEQQAKERGTHAEN